MADPDPQKKGGGLKKKSFRPFWPQFGQPLDPPLTLLIRDLKPALNENISSKKLYLY